MNADSKIFDFFVAGGTLRPDAPSYVKRPADDQLFDLAQAGAFCYVLTARQMGKSSLMTRTERRLREAGVNTATIDLTSIGTVTIDAWYLGMLTELTRQLRLATDVNAWWQERAWLGQPQRFTHFLRDVVLTEIKGQVVVLIDEIDSTLKLEFADDFFAAIRFTYNARAADAVYVRLSFVLLGVATPSDLIKDASRTPFNVGQAIDLCEFTWADAQPLRQGLTDLYPEQGEVLLQRIFYWTNGHPYLTQKLCSTVVKTGDGSWSENRVDELVERLFLSEEAQNEDNLKFVQRNVAGIKGGQRRRLLKLYRWVYEEKKVKEEQQSLDQNRLKLFALVGAKNGLLQVRNEIYRRAFNLDWIKANTPVDWNRWIAAAAVLVALVLGLYIWQQGQQTTETLAQTYADNFNNTTNPVLRLGALANLFGLEGYGDEALALFDTLSPADKMALFSNTTPDLQPQVRTAVKGVYTHLDNTQTNNRLLQTMQTALEQSGEADSKILAIEIGHWLDGRAALAAKNYEEAKRAYTEAIKTNDQNPATHFERALVLAALEDYQSALANLDTALTLDQNKQGQVRQAIMSNRQLYNAWWDNQKAYPALVRVVPTPTSTPTPTDTPTLAPSTATPTSEPTWTPTNTLVPPTPTSPPISELTATPLPSSSVSIPTEGLVAYWNFDDCKTIDITGQGHNGNIFGSPDCIDGVKGKAFKFKGQDYIEIPYDPQLAPSNYTINLWYKIDNLTPSTMMVKSSIKDNATGLIYYDISFNQPGNLAVMYEDAQNQNYYMVTSQGNEVGRFFMVTLTFADRNFKVFVNSQKAEEGNFAGNPVDDLSGVLIGCRFDWGGCFEGVLDEIRIYNHVLSDSEIQALYNEITGSR